jgi:hypothetical protein
MMSTEAGNGSVANLLASLTGSGVVVVISPKILEQTPQRAQK